MSDAPMRRHSEGAWAIASQWSYCLASDTRTLAAQIDDLVAEARAERDEADRLAGEAERRRKYDEDELIRLRWWSERVKEAIGLRFNDSLDDVIPEIERALSALKEPTDE